MNSHQGFKTLPTPCTLEQNGVRLEPLSLAHETGLRLAAADGELWRLRMTSVPEPENTAVYIQAALEGQKAGSMLPFAVIDTQTSKVLGSTRYHGVVPTLARLEIGYTWYAQSHQRTHVNTVCKLMLLEHAFDHLGAAVVGWRTDHLNATSQRAIERLGAKLDGVLRHHALRRDGSVRDSYMYSVIKSEWPQIHHRLLDQLKRHYP
jgi:RimJ/RimL family protein N-acetyltransferase